uniref:Phospholipase/carboxylesterase/thioesterase domain-containing protein n=1 Tax=Alexandrium catenella TaxID=2925 RepID=A0A7S1WRS4_ALECA
MMCGAVHQFGLVGKPDYDSKWERLRQILERLPTGSGAAVVFAEPDSVHEAQAIVESYRMWSAGEGARSRRVFRQFQKLRVASPCANCSCPALPATACPPLPSAVPMRVDVVMSSVAEVPPGDLGYRYVINYDTPTSGRQYLERVRLIAGSSDTSAPGVIYTFFEGGQLSSRGCREIASLVQRARRSAALYPELGGVAKAAEFESALQQIDDTEEEEEDSTEQENDGTDSAAACDCMHCTGRSLGSTTYHMGIANSLAVSSPQVEVVRVPMRALENLDMVAPLIAPRLQDHFCTMVCLHNLNCHTPWDGQEHLFALPPGMGSIRVVMVLANDASWHDYPDVGSFSGGVAWVDILDGASMDKTDQLISRLVEHEVGLLGQHSERVFLMGMSQGGAQSMLRFLRSRQRLGGWFGAVCHAPTAPHMPLAADPLLVEDRPLVNLDQPMRFLSGEVDSVFPAPLVLRDAERLRTVGGFTDVTVKVQEGLRHEGLTKDVEAEERGESVKRGPPQELLYLQQQWPSMLAHLATPESPASQ